MLDTHFMDRALALAVRGIGRVEPNPPVGCVIVRDGQIIAEGFHERFGAPHAEVNALTAAGERVYARVVPMALEYERSLLTPLSKRDRETLDRLLRVLLGRAVEMGPAHTG